MTVADEGLDLVSPAQAEYWEGYQAYRLGWTVQWKLVTTAFRQGYEAAIADAKALARASHD